MKKQLIKNNDVKPEIGMGVTLTIHTDRFCATITRISDSGKTFWCRTDKAIRVDDNGMSDVQNYLYEIQPDGEEIQVRQRKNGTWKAVGLGYRVSLGVRRAYHDYSF